MYDVVVKKFTFAISSPDEFLLLLAIIDRSEESSLFQRGGGDIVPSTSAVQRPITTMRMQKTPNVNKCVV